MITIESLKSYSKNNILSIFTIEISKICQLSYSNSREIFPWSILMKCSHLEYELNLWMQNQILQNLCWQYQIWFQMTKLFRFKDFSSLQVCKKKIRREKIQRVQMKTLSRYFTRSLLNVNLAMVPSLQMWMSVEALLSLILSSHIILPKCFFSWVKF